MVDGSIYIEAQKICPHASIDTCMK